jgi:hypothetical protein
VERPSELHHASTALGTQFDPRQRRDLQFRIRSSLVKCAESRDDYFLPNDQLQHIMTYENLRGELERLDMPSHEIPEITNFLCQRKRSSLRIFAILCMLQSFRHIVAFIR